jgi:hypothetical protein
MLANSGRPRTRRFSESVPLGVSPLERATSSQQAVTPTLPNQYNFDPMLYPPPGARIVVNTDYWVSAAAGNNAPALLSRRVDRGYVHVIDAINIFADSPILSTRATWQIRIDGVPATDPLTMIFRAASSLSQTFDRLRLLAKSEQLVDVLITNVDGAAKTFAAQLSGWTYQPAAIVAPQGS